MNIMKRAKVKLFFEHLYTYYNNSAYIHTDPIYFPHSLEGNKEFIGFTAALFAYGRVAAIKSLLTAFFGSCGTVPATLRSNPQNLKYRFQNEKDISVYCKIMQEIYLKEGCLENLFDGHKEPYEAARIAVERIRSYTDALTGGLSFLFALPGNSASKRLMMFLRWMIRKDAVDFGLWKSFSASSLSVPLDTHVTKLSIRLGIISEKEGGKKALDKVNAFFRELSPDDPVKYDFALTRLGIAEGCIYEGRGACRNCAHRDLCVFN